MLPERIFTFILKSELLGLKTPRGGGGPHPQVISQLSQAQGADRL